MRLCSNSPIDAKVKVVGSDRKRPSHFAGARTATMDPESPQSLWATLLFALKETAEGLLSTPTTNVWNVYGGLSRLSRDVDAILKHGLKVSQTPSGTSVIDYVQFVKGLRYLSPALAPPADRVRHAMLEMGSTADDEGLAWVRLSLQEHALAARLSALVTSRQHMWAHYYDYAFLQNSRYYGAMRTCLLAVEQNRSSLLAEIDHTLVSKHCHGSGVPLQSQEVHVAAMQVRPGGGQRSASLLISGSSVYSDIKAPVRRIYSSSEVSIDAMLANGHHAIEDCQTDLLSKGQLVTTPRPLGKPLKHTASERCLTGIVSASSGSTCMQQQSCEAEASSPPDARQPTLPQAIDIILQEDVAQERSVADVSPANPKRLSHHRSKSDVPFVLPEAEPSVNRSSPSTPNDEMLSSSVPLRRDSADSSYWGSMSDIYSGRPKRGESLTSFLSAQDSVTCTDLDRENAHFSICEALIAAIEQVKWNHSAAHLRSGNASPESCRRQPLDHDGQNQPRVRLANDAGVDMVSSPLLSSTTTSYNGSGASSSTAPSSRTDTPTTRSWERGPNTFTAESVALALLRKFSEHQLPKASELDWMVLEKDTPQDLLPIPDSFLELTPSDPLTLGHPSTSVRMRGNLSWAPPRPQIIFSVHPTPKRKNVIAKQNYLCAGCGRTIEPDFIKRYRYCEYLGKYFCQCCHTNKTAIVPGRVLFQWDFTLYPVSNFAHDLLERIHSDPLYNVVDINAALLRKAKAVEAVLVSRQQLRFLRPFLTTCRDGSSLSAELSKLPEYQISDPPTFSMEDLIATKSGELGKELSRLVNVCIDHVFNCRLCHSKGFVCELCSNEKDVIFPFQLGRVYRCESCRSCYHRSCLSSGKVPCPKCARIEQRRARLQRQTDD